eukprot:2811-Heterococcus_DN1.PRE.3
MQQQAVGERDHTSSGRASVGRSTCFDSSSGNSSSAAVAAVAVTVAAAQISSCTNSIPYCMHYLVRHCSVV